MCLQCSAKAEYVFKEHSPQFLGDYSIMVATESNEIWNDEWDINQVGFVQMNDPDFVLNWLKIYPDKLGKTLDEFEDDDDMIEILYDARNNFDLYPIVGHYVVNSAIDQGYVDNNCLELWLLHRFHEFYPYMKDDIKKFVVV